MAYIINKYINEQYSLKQLGKEFNCSYGTIRNLLHRKGYESRGNKQGYPRNEFYFNKIDTPSKAYWLGFLYADGRVHSNSNEISITLKDKEHLEKFRQALECFNHHIGKTKDDRFLKESVIYYISLKDKQLHDDLIKWGCVPQKSLKLDTLPLIENNLMSHFIRGYFDGDGSLHYVKANSSFRVSFSGTEKFLSNIKKVLGKEHLKLTLQEKRVPQLQIIGNKQVKEVLNYLYKNSCEANRLNRKYQIYKDNFLGEK